MAAKRKSAARARTGRTAGKTSSRKKAARSATSRRATAKAKRKSAAKKRVTRKKAAKKPSAASRRVTVTPRKRAVPKKKTVKKRPSLGRARLPADARLDLVFQKDYQAREIFEFLRVQTLRELEEWSPDEIIEKLTGPLVQTVERIRKALALSNRCLAKDQKFALRFKAELQRRR